MTTVHVAAAGGSYDIQIARGLLARGGEAIRAAAGGATAALIADANAGALYGDAVEDSLPRGGLSGLPDGGALRRGQQVRCGIPPAAGRGAPGRV